MGVVLRGVLTWWGAKRAPARVELYTRWTFHFVALVELVGVAGQVALAEGNVLARTGLAGLISVHAGLTGLACSRALDSAMDQRERPTVLPAASVVVSIAATGSALALGRAGELPSSGPMVPAVLGPVIFGPVPLALILRPRRVTQVVFGAGVLVSLGASSALTLPLRGALGWGATSLVGGLVMAFAARFSHWLLAVVRELDAARGTQARLAVAEERLRFGRDLHDVVGRNLTVIALKGELAVHLARSGSPAAVEQMTEVQRIAQDTQREVAEVVRGYREADLHTELVGAREVLRAAGIDCDIDDGDVGMLPQTAASLLGWVIREGTTNVLRHSNADRCTIRVRNAPGIVARMSELVMENNGVPPVGAAGQGGVGLVGLAERLAAHGGTLSAERCPRGRFLLTARVPTARTAADRKPEPALPEPPEPEGT